MDNKDQIQGKAEQAIADLSDDKDLAKQGKADQKAGDVKEFLEDAKDKLEHLVDSVKDKLHKS